MIAHYSLSLLGLVVNGQPVEFFSIEWEDDEATDESVKAAVKEWVRLGQNPGESKELMARHMPGLEKLVDAAFYVDILPDRVPVSQASNSRIRPEFLNR